MKTCLNHLAVERTVGLPGAYIRARRCDMSQDGGRCVVTVSTTNSSPEIGVVG
jgi:hypothetical protein